jgi:hypothetical protein
MKCVFEENEQKNQKEYSHEIKMNTGSATVDFSTNSSCIIFQYIFKLKTQ